MTMIRPTTHIASIILVCAVAAVVLAHPAAGQIDPGEISQLEGRRDEIVTELGALDSQIIQAGADVDDLVALIDRREIEIEITADRIAITADSRREPANTRSEIALAGYTAGDPRGNALLTEIQTLEGDDSGSRRREFYSAVIEDAQGRLDAIDAALVAFRSQLAAERNRLEDANSQKSVAVEALATLGTSRTELALELDDVRQRIERLRSLENHSILTGLVSYDDPNRPALAVKIDNVRAARPQSGINQADIVFVEEVEGGLTRIAAVFHSTGAEVVGPVRSMRTGDFDLLGQLNSPLFGNSGGNRVARALLVDSTLQDVGAWSKPEGYYRNNSRKAPHNLFSNTFNLWTIGTDLDTASPSPIFHFRGAQEPINANARAVNGVMVNYPRSRVEYSWDGTGWQRSQDGSPTVDTSGQRTAPTTVIIQFVEYGISAADAESPEAVSLGTGVAWVLSDGQVIDAVWRRPELTDQTEYVDSDGRPIAILPGRTWIELPRPDSATLR